MMDDKLVYDFFLGLPKDSAKLLIYDILDFDENQIEYNHNFIQWIFPTKEKSQVNDKAPQISEKFEKLFLNNETVQENFCKSCKMFLNFIGFDCSCNKGDNVITNIKNKKKYYDLPSHNFLRITRVLNSLRQIGNGSCSKKLFAELEKIRNENRECKKFSVI